MISYVLPTHNRHQTLNRTLDRLGQLDGAGHRAAGNAEIIVVDNASEPPVSLVAKLDNGIIVRVIRLEHNIGAAARNVGVDQARGHWIVMLDDDSYPLDCGHINVIGSAPDHVAAIGAEILLPDGSHEAGGLPEVIIGCGAAIRRSAFCAVGGYDPSFDYYAEEYDLCARFLLAGWQVIHDRRFRVLHEKITTHRDMNRILHRLVRNNAWVMQRYAPCDNRRSAEVHSILTRYASIAVKEHAAHGYACGVADLLTTIDAQPRRAMTQSMFERFTGLHHVRQTLRSHPGLTPGMAVALVEPGKNVDVMTHAALEAGLRLVAQPREAQAMLIGTLSPGPMLDAQHRWSKAHPAMPVVCGWSLQGEAPPDQQCAARVA